MKREKILSEEKTYEPAVPDREDYKELGRETKSLKKRVFLDRTMAQASIIPKISVLICAYNEERTIERTIESILNQVLKPYEIIVVNDGSTDRTREILKKYEKNPSITIVDLPTNSGRKARAQKAAIDYITGDLIALIDADTEVNREFLLRLAAHFVDKSVGGSAGRVFSKRRSWITAVRQIEYLIAFGPTGRLGMNVLNAVLVMPGCGCMVRRELFDPSDDTVSEDMDLTLSILERGYKVVYEPKAIAYTEDPPTLRLYIKQIIRWYSGALQNFRKHWKRLPTHIKSIIAILFFELTSFPLVISAFSLLSMLNPSYLTILLIAILMDSIPVIIAGLYGFFKFKRKDVLLAIFPAILVKYLHYIVWFYCLFKEYVLEKEMRWLRSK